MIAILFFPNARPIISRAALGAAVFLCGCMKGDEELQRQLVATRTALEAKTKALDQAQSQAADSAKDNARVSELEQQLAAALLQPAAPGAPQKLDLDALKDKLEADLTSKARQLRELVLKQTGAVRIDEISIKGIDYPPQIITPFRSAITFALSGDGGQAILLMFPVTADLNGSWKLPGPDKVQQAYKEAKNVIASNARAAVNAESNPLSPSQGPTAPSTGTAGFRQIDPNTYLFDFGDKRGPAATPGLPQSPVPSAPPSQSSASPPNPQPSVTVPSPIMPVQRDIIIKF